MTVTEGKNTGGGTESKKETHLSLASSKPNNSVKRMAVSTRDKADDETFRSKTSGILDLRSQYDWDSFLANQVINDIFKTENL